MEIQTKNLTLVLQSTEQVLAWVDSLDAATRAVTCSRADQAVRAHRLFLASEFSAMPG